MRKSQKFGAKATPHAAHAVIALESRSTRLCPTMSPRRANTGTVTAETSNCAASNQFTSASWMPRCRAISV